MAAPALGEWWAVTVFDNFVIRGRYQPESYEESFEVAFSDQEHAGTMHGLHFKGFKPKTVTLSFIVDNMLMDSVDIDKVQFLKEVPSYKDPELMYRYLLEAARPRSTRVAGGRRFSPQTPVSVNFPGWHADCNGKAFITSVKIERTHINSVGRAVRAKITVTFREAWKANTQNGQDVGLSASYGEEMMAAQNQAAAQDANKRAIVADVAEKRANPWTAALATPGDAAMNFMQ